MNREWSVFRGAVLVAAGTRGLLAAIGFTCGILLARGLPPGDLGAYFLLEQSAVVLGLFFACGTSGANQRFLAIAAARFAWDEVGRLLRYTARLTGATALIGTLAVLLLWRGIAALLGAPELVPLVWALIGMATARAGEEIASAYFRSAGRPRTGVLLLGLPRQAAFLLGIAALAWWGGGLQLNLVVYWRMGTAVCAAALGLTLVIGHLRRQVPQQSWSPPAFGEYRQTAMTLLGHLVAVYLLGHQDLWFIGIFLNKETVGLYGVMLQLTQLIAVFLGVVNLIVPPMISSMYDQGRKDDVEHLMRRISTLAGWFALLVLVVLAVFGGRILGLVYGSRFVAGHAILVVLAAGQAFNVAVGSPGHLLQVTGHHRTLLRTTILSLTVNGVLNYVGVHVFGAMGVAVATAVTIILQSVLLTTAARRRTGIRTWALPNPLPAVRGALR